MLGEPVKARPPIGVEIGGSLAMQMLSKQTSQSGPHCDDG
jgi:hypothetical protein